MSDESQNDCSSRGGLAGGAAAVSASAFLLRRWQRPWNATAEEIARPLPLDDEVSEPTYVTNRAITVPAGPEDVWPWIAQMGELPRGGFYSYVAVERLLGSSQGQSCIPVLLRPRLGVNLKYRNAPMPTMPD